MKNSMMAKSTLVWTTDGNYVNFPSQSMEALKAIFKNWAMVRYGTSLFGPKEGGLWYQYTPPCPSYKVRLCNLTLKYSI